MIDDKPTIYHYTGNGVAVEYFYPAPIYNADELIVRVDSADVTGYTVDLETANGKPADLANPVVSAKVTFNTAPADQAVVSIRQNVPADQTVDYSPFERFPADLHEQAIDKQTLVVQRIRDELVYKISLDPDQPLPTYDVIFPAYLEGAIPMWSDVEGVLENFELGTELEDLQTQITDHVADVANPHETPTNYAQETEPGAARVNDTWTIPSTGQSFIRFNTGTQEHWVEQCVGNIAAVAPVVPPPSTNEIANASDVAGTTATDALNQLKFDDDIDYDIQYILGLNPDRPGGTPDPAGSPTYRIIAGSRRNDPTPLLDINLDPVFQNTSAALLSDINSVGDGNIPSDAEQTAWDNKVSATGSVTTHSDVSNAGSGAIITNQERSDIYGLNEASTSVATNSPSTSLGAPGDLMPSMSVTVTGPGTFLCVFDGTGNVDSDDHVMSYYIRQDAVAAAWTLRQVFFKKKEAIYNIHSELVTVVGAGSHTFDVWWYTTDTANVHERSLSVIKLSE